MLDGSVIVVAGVVVIPAVVVVVVVAIVVTVTVVVAKPHVQRLVTARWHCQTCSQQ